MGNKAYKVAIIALAWGAMIVSCKTNKVERVSETEVLDLPTQEILDFKYHHTEQGVLRYELEARQAKLFSIADTPYIAFPKGLYVVSFTADSIPESDMVADSAVFREQPRFFSATGNVVVRNFIKKMRMETDGPLYWDEVKREIYTDARAIIINDQDTIPAMNGLVADDRFVTYTLRKVQHGIIHKELGTKDTSGHEKGQ